MLLTAGSIFSRNVVGPIWPNLSDRTNLLLSRTSMIVFAAIAVWLTIGASSSLVEIGLRAYAAIGMLAPGVLLAFLWRRANAIGVLAGMIAGYVALLHPAAQALWDQHLPGWDRGLVAMGVNMAVALVVGAITGRDRSRGVRPVATAA